jgi:hypothetical protein
MPAAVSGDGGVGGVGGVGGDGDIVHNVCFQTPCGTAAPKASEHSATGVHLLLVPVAAIQVVLARLRIITFM